MATKGHSPKSVMVTNGHSSRLVMVTEGHVLDPVMAPKSHSSLAPVSLPVPGPPVGWSRGKKGTHCPGFSFFPRDLLLLHSSPLLSHYPDSWCAHFLCSDHCCSYIGTWFCFFACWQSFSFNSLWILLSARGTQLVLMEHFLITLGWLMPGIAPSARHQG